jgi:hypothetical protein
MTFVTVAPRLASPPTALAGTRAPTSTRAPDRRSCLPSHRKRRRAKRRRSANAVLTGTTIAATTPIQTH